MNLEIRAIGLVCRGLRTVVLVMKLHMVVKKDSSGRHTLTKQAILVHLTLGTQRLDEPVSRTTLKVWKGVPNSTVAKYWAFMKSTSGDTCKRQSPQHFRAYVFV